MEQEFLYDKVCKELAIEVVKDGEYIIDDSSAIVKRLLRLVQVASNPRLVNESFEGVSAKETLLDKLINDIVAADEKCIVWSNFIDNINYFEKKI